MARGGRGGGRRSRGGRGGRGAMGGGRSSRGGKGVSKGRPDGNMGMRREDFEDEIDEFAKGKDKVGLNMEEDSEVSGSDAEEDEAVFDVKGADSDEDSDEEDEFDEDDDEELGGMTAKLSKQAKFMKQKLAAMGVGNEDEEENEEDEDEKKLWGKQKKVYYGGDNVDLELTDDEEAPLEEEEIALEQQRKLAQSLRPEDYEQESEDESEEETPEAGEETLGEAANRAAKGFSKGVSENGVTVEEVKKDLDSLTKEEKLAAVMSEAPELVSLLGELRDGLREITEKVQPVLRAVKDGKYATQDGISYLEAKHLLLLTYCQNIVFYLLLKAEGRPVRDHPVITRMVELRLFLEKIRPIDKKLQYQIDKLLTAAKEPAANGDATPGDGAAPADALKFRPNPDALVSKLDEEGADGLYRPPMMTPAAMAEDPDKRNRKEERSRKESARKASRSALVRTLAEEIEGRPEEVREDAVRAESQRLLRERARLQARAEAEEDLFTRVPLTKAERARQKSVKRLTGMSDMLDDFDDDVADLVAEGEREEGARGGAPPEDLLKRKKLSQAVMEEARPEKRARVLSGDADLPVRETLGERRKKHDVRIPRGGSPSGSEPDEAGPSGDFEDEFYKAAKEQSQLKKAAKAAKYDRGEGRFAAEEDLAEGKRGINKQIEKNKGLTPHRKKAIKNPRVKQRMRHAKAVINRKGQVREARTHTSGYGGEASGIKSSISRSVRMQS